MDGEATQEELEELGLNPMGSGEAKRLVPGRGLNGSQACFFGLRRCRQGRGIAAPPGCKGSFLPSSFPPQTLGRCVGGRQGFSSHREEPGVFT